MSDRLKSTQNVSNEEVIDDLTKDLETALRSGSDGDFVVSPGSRAEDFQPSAGDSARGSHTGGVPLDYEDPDKSSKAESDEEDSDADSVSLKDAEVELTKDEIEQRWVIAEMLKTRGNESYRVADYETSLERYTKALHICPLQYSQLRSVLYCNRSAVKMKQKKYKQAIKDCTKAIELEDKYLKAYYRRAQCYEATDKLDECLADYKKILELDPSHKEAQAATLRLPPMIEERNEKLKTEMLGKLKDLGNMILKPFGLSTENFQLEQDSESKGYKINFKQ